jgi:hypothetical protein
LLLELFDFHVIRGRLTVHCQLGLMKAVKCHQSFEYEAIGKNMRKERLMAGGDLKRERIRRPRKHPAFQTQTGQVSLNVLLS